MSLAPLSPQAFHILIALADRDQHGYGIMEDVAARTGGKLRLGAGTLYGLIKRLLEDGLVVELRENQRSALTVKVDISFLTRHTGAPGKLGIFGAGYRQ